MPSWQNPVCHPASAAHRRVAALLVTLASASCQSLFGGFATDNQDNCVHNAALCPAPDQVCNQSTKLCEPATILTTVDPPGGTNVGGTLLTITGDRFVPGMTVNIDGVPATAVMVNGAQQLTAVTPPRPGRQGPVVVELVNLEGQHVQQSSLFRYYAEVAFQQKCFQGPSGVSTILAADLNGDGKTDLLTTSFSLIRSYLSSGDGQTFQNPFDVTPGITPRGLAVADMNGDGKVDLALPYAVATNSVATALGNGDGTFQALVKTATTNPPYGLALADINGDKRLDAVSLQNENLVVQLGSGDGKFLAEQNTPYAALDSRASSTMTLADLDGDGIPDVIPLNPVDQNFLILFGQAGGWTPPLANALSAVPFIALVSDYNQDGVLDVAVGLNRSSAKIAFYQGLGGRQFSALPGLTLQNNFQLQAQGEVNGN